MTVASSATAEFTVDSIVRKAYILAGLMDVQEPASGVQWNARAAFARDMLEMLVKRLEAKGKLVRAREYFNVQLVAGQSEYPLPSSLMDVYEDGAFIPLGQPVDAAVGEIPVKPIDLEQWQRLGTHGATSRPYFYLAYRAADPITIRVWPTPTAADAGTIRFQVYRFLANSTGGTNTVDLERYWQLALTYMLAGIVAQAATLDTAGGLAQQGEQYMIEALGYSRQRTPGQAIMVVQGPYPQGRHRR